MGYWRVVRLSYSPARGKMLESRSRIPIYKGNKMKIVINFITESIAEFKKVQWPTKGQTLRLTGFVIGVSLIIGVYVSGLDFGYKKLLNLVIK